LASFEILDTPREAAFDDIAALAGAICGVPVSAISLIDRDRQWFKAACGLDATESPRDIAICAHTILSRTPTVVEDLAADERFSDNPMVKGTPGFRFYAAAPILSSEGYAVGSLCIAGFEPKRLEGAQIAALSILARQASAQMELRRTVSFMKRQAAALDDARESGSPLTVERLREFRTAMTGILGLADLLSTSGTTAREREYASTIAEGGRSMMALLHHAELDSRSSSLREAVELLVALLRPTALANQVRLTLEVAEEIETLVVVPGEFRRALYGPLDAVVRTPGCRQAQIVVHRRGASPYVEIVAELEAGPSGGDGDEAAGKVRAYHSPLPGYRPPEPPHALVVEDNEVNSLILTSMLNDLGCRTTAVADGQAALQALDQQPYSIVFMDIQMPGMDGLTATRRYREAEGSAKTPIVAITASRVGDDEKYATAGFDRVIEKPFYERDIAALLSEFIRIP
jgi:CheY-like chemotaxis protein/GAF domain-containing protein